MGRDGSHPYPDYVDGYIKNPRETYQCELKPWLYPNEKDQDKVKIAKACLALKNWGGKQIGHPQIGVNKNKELAKYSRGCPICSTSNQIKHDFQLICTQNRTRMTSELIRMIKEFIKQKSIEQDSYTLAKQISEKKNRSESQGGFVKDLYTGVWSDLILCG